MELYKLHATGNDFLIFDAEDLSNPGTQDPRWQEVFNSDPDSPIPAEWVRQLCDRHFGFGADGLIRVAKLGGRFFMDYRNSDGTLAEMCGNGIRAFVHFLRYRKQITLSAGESVEIATRAGIKTVAFLGKEYLVDMGQAQFESDSYQVKLSGLLGERSGYGVKMPNPHVVVVLDEGSQLEQIVFPTDDPEKNPLLAPRLQPRPENGANVEAIVLDPENARIDMRVCERGVGETLSCGTGCCAVASVASKLYPQIDTWKVHVPGGILTIYPGRLETASIGEVIEGVDTQGGKKVFMQGSATLVGKVVLASTN